MARVLVTGANGVVGQPLRERLESDQETVCYISRKSSSDNKKCLQWDMQEVMDEQLSKQLLSYKIDTLIHCAPIWLLPDHLEKLAELGVNRIVAFSSSSVTSKKDSKDVNENQLVKQLSDAEQKLKRLCLSNDINLTIFRPSMIYGYARDENITHIANFIKRYRFFLLIGQAKGLRQPVHADDLVEATMQVMDNSVTYGKTYYLAGGEELTYKAMVERIFVGLNKSIRIIYLPLGVFRLGLKIAALFGRFSYTAEMANRINQNLNYDNSSAQQDFSYAPQAFLSQPKRDLIH